jgi:hypothetical protein
MLLLNKYIRVPLTFLASRQMADWRLAGCHGVNKLTIHLHVCAWSFHQFAILSTWHFVNLTFCQLDILSTWHFVNLTFCQLDILSTWHFVNLTFCQLDILSTWHFVNLTFCQHDILSTWRFVNLPFHHLALLATTQIDLIDKTQPYCNKRGISKPFCSHKGISFTDIFTILILCCLNNFECGCSCAWNVWSEL